MRLFNRGKDASSSDSPYPSSARTHLPSTDTSTGPARPLRLVYCDEKGKFQMDPEAVAVLQLVKGPIGVVSVCGRARQGKSFILNQVITMIAQVFFFFFLLQTGLGFAFASRLALCVNGKLYFVPGSSHISSISCFSFTNDYRLKYDILKIVLATTEPPTG